MTNRMCSLIASATEGLWLIAPRAIFPGGLNDGPDDVRVARAAADLVAELGADRRAASSGPASTTLMGPIFASVKT